MTSYHFKVYISLLFLKSTSLRPNMILLFDFLMFISGLNEFFFGCMDVWTQKINWTYIKAFTSYISPTYLIDYMYFTRFWTYGRTFSL